MGPEHLLDSKSRGLDRLTEKMTAFYEQFKQEDVVKIDEPGFLEGKKFMLASCSMGVLSPPPPYLVIDKYECSVQIYRGPWPSQGLFFVT